MQDDHLSSEELMLSVDGELAPDHVDMVRSHLAACAYCRERLEQTAYAMTALVRAHQDVPLPPAAAARTQLQSRLAEMATAPSPERAARWPLYPALAAAAILVCAVALMNMYQHRRIRPAFVPSPQLTPGLARAIDRDQLCNSELPKNQVVTADMRRRVFEVYGISNADPRAYEVDYLITPALGGADDIRNLWPQPYLSTAWNARVKDALEDRLRDMVCSGELDLARAQRDIATNWVAAYKKYFQTNDPPPFDR
jgi:Putative zinc-finger